MTEKSHVTLECHVCLVCGQQHDTGSILLDRRLRPVFESRTTTGWGLCSEHQRLYDEGYLALVEIDPVRSGVNAATSNVRPEAAYRTGRVVHLKRYVADRVFATTWEQKIPCVFVEQEVIDKIAAMAEPSPGP